MNTILAVMARHLNVGIPRHGNGVHNFVNNRTDSPVTFFLHYLWVCVKRLGKKNQDHSHGFHHEVFLKMALSYIFDRNDPESFSLIYLVALHLLSAGVCLYDF